MQITDLSEEMKIPVLLRLAFRPLFLGASLFSIIAIAFWGLLLSGHGIWQTALPPVFWHSHEMLFGFTSAVVAGFLLTAMQNWTGLRAPHGKQLLLLVSVWLLARVLLILPVAIPIQVLMAVDLAFLPIAAILLAKPIIAAQQYRNLFFIPVLLLLTLCNASMWAGLWSNQEQLIRHGSTSTVFLITMVMAIVGGRVLPMFTANGTKTKRVESLVWLDRLSLGMLWLVFFIHFLHLQQLVPPIVLASLFGGAALFSAIRIARLKIWITFGTPLLWSLHLAYWCIPLGMALFAARYSGMTVSHSLALHCLTVGGMGGMILAMMARVSLGHTGRMLQPHPLMSSAFAAMLLALACRVLLPLIKPELYVTAIIFTSLLWCFAFGCFVLIYWRILTSPRADGHPG